MKKTTGKRLNIEWNIKAKHILYCEDGKWYHLIKDFPGALCDKNGYVLFNTKEEYLNNKYLQIKTELHVSNGISVMPGYKKMK